MNGSNSNGGCPSEYVGTPSNNIRTCDCLGTGIGEEAITGVLIDDTVPTIDTAQTMWASQLFTVMGGASGSNVTIGVRFSSGVALREVVIYLFNCPAWGIGAETIFIHYAQGFPTFTRVFDSLGSTTLTSTETQNCNSLTRVSIPIQPTFELTNYYIEFHNPSGAAIQWVHIGEVRFSDQPIIIQTTTETAPATTTANPTTMEVTTAGKGFTLSITLIQ